MNLRLVLPIVVARRRSPCSRYSMLFIVEQTEQAIVLQFGEPKRVVEQPGLAGQAAVAEASSPTTSACSTSSCRRRSVTAADQKRLIVDTYARFRITDPLQFYQSVGTEQVGAHPPRRRSSAATLRRIIGNVELADGHLRQARQASWASIRDDGERPGEDASASTSSTCASAAPICRRRTARRSMPACSSEREREAAQFRAEGDAAGQADPRRRRPPAHRDHRRGAEAVADPARPGRCATASASMPTPSARTRISSRSTARCRPIARRCASQDTTFVLSPDSEFFRYFELRRRARRRRSGEGEA